VEDTPGVTRDRIFCDCEWCGHKFLLVDTGGIEPNIDDGQSVDLPTLGRPTMATIGFAIVKCLLT